MRVFKQVHIKVISDHRVPLKLGSMIYHTKFTKEQYSFIQRPLGFIDDRSAFIDGNPKRYMYASINKVMQHMGDQKYLMNLNK